jgi:uncharacterized protein DUF1553/uncharacterized protein DUF1549/cytochrome c
MIPPRDLRIGNGYLFLSTCWALLFFLALPARIEAQTGGRLPGSASHVVEYERDVRPIFQEKCYGCHGAALQMNGLRLDNRAAALAGGYSGPVIRPGKSAESLLIHRVLGTVKLKVMPPTGERLSAEQVGVLRVWIDEGAQWPDEATVEAKTSEAKSRHWAFGAIERPVVPDVKRRDWVRNPIDAFVLDRLEAKGIAPSAEADRVTLVRRLSLDLTGLPPTLKEVNEFVGDTRPDAYDRLVERLLASPHYGEKWARSWLDLARYADSDGYNDDVRPHAWRYRQWVIDALNRNLPFDQFTIEQIAGDLLPDATVEQKVATGFNRNTLTNRETGTDSEEFRVEQIIDRASTLGTVWLGLTVGCARCHDHKYDPLTQREFYQLYAFFNSDVEVNIEAPLGGEMGPFLQRKPEHDKKRQEVLAEYPKVTELQPEWESKVLAAGINPAAAELLWMLQWKRLRWRTEDGQEILKLAPSQRTQKQKDKLTNYFIKFYADIVGEERAKELKLKELDGKLAKLAEEFPGLSEAQTLAVNPHPPKTHILLRGNFQQPGVEVQPGTPAFLPALKSDSKPSRLALARWLVSKDNPLTPRVTVNRMWQEFFGRGLVDSSEDFGTRGDRPSHPELLDWMAAEFVSSGWDVKEMHKRIVSSATYRQSSRMRQELQGVDPNNKLFARQARLRLPAELIRDVTLAASGLLNPTIGGKSVCPPLPAGMADLGHFLRGWEESQGADRYRRGLYTLYKRVVLYPQFQSFDAPDAQQACSRRERSTTPLQALNLLNDPVFVEAAQGLATRILREKTGNVGDRLEYAFRLCLARSPKPEEKERLLASFRQQNEILERNPKAKQTMFPAKTVEGVEGVEVASWVGLSSILLNLDEFITRE